MAQLSAAHRWARRLAQCRTAEFPAHLQLRIARRARNLSEITLEFRTSPRTEADAMQIFLRADRGDTQAEPFLIWRALGDVAAHEIGISCWARTRTRRTGSCAHVRTRRTCSISAGTLFFPEAESRQMKNKLAAWRSQARDASTLLQHVWRLISRFCKHGVDHAEVRGRSWGLRCLPINEPDSTSDGGMKVFAVE